ncbi:MAG: Txe/YoeB family addiction module toxin [Eubacteriales bacterium]
MPNVSFSKKAFSDYKYWIANDVGVVEKINALIEDISREGISKGRGKPEPLKGRKEWSRRINNEDRLVYTMDAEKTIQIRSCRGHYDS